MARDQDKLKRASRNKREAWQKSSTQSETKSRMAQKEPMKVEARNGYKDVRFPRTGGLSGMAEVRKYHEQQRCLTQRMYQEATKCRKEQRTMTTEGNKG